MSSEREKMIRGERYDPRDPELVAARVRARHLLQAYNATDPEDAGRERLLRELIPAAGTPVWIEPPFFCDYGWNITLGANFYCNFNCVVLDICPVSIGANVLLGPAVQLYAASHPLSPALRRTGIEDGAPITIGDDVWIGGGSIVLPGVSIGAGTTIGAGSVLTRDIPGGVLAAGNPCRVIRGLEATPRAGAGTG
jgi:maltose O-acetyltransferase